MVDKRAIRSLLRDMERSAEEILLHDSAFFEAMQALKWEIDNDPRVQSTVRRLQAAGQKVFSSFVPHIKVRIRTEKGIIGLAKPLAMSSSLPAGPVARLTEELKNAASAVITTSRYCQELERIINEAIAANDGFENIACDIERAGYEVLISLDLSAYAHVQASSAPVAPEHADCQEFSEEPVNIELSAQDISFLKALKITADKSL
jgi:hypothetical protein